MKTARTWDEVIADEVKAYKEWQVGKTQAPLDPTERHESTVTGIVSNYDGFRVDSNTETEGEIALSLRLVDQTASLRRALADALEVVVANKKEIDQLRREVTSARGAIQAADSLIRSVRGCQSTEWDLVRALWLEE